MKASDISLSVDDRKKALEDYDKLYAEYNNSDEEDALKEAAEEAFGKGTFNSTKFYNGLSGEYEKYFTETSNETNRTKLTGKTESFTVNLIDDFMSLFSRNLDDAYNKKLEAYRVSLEKSYSQAKGENDDTVAMVMQIQQTAAAAWNKAENELLKKAEEWEDGFIEKYKKEMSEWDSQYSDFEAEKQKWVNGLYLDAAAETAVEKSGAASADDSIALLKKRREARRRMPEAEIETDYTEKLLGKFALDKVASRLESLSQRITDNRMAVAVKTEATDDFNALSSAMEVLEAVNARIKETAAKLAAQEMIGNLEEMRHAYYDQIDDLNLNYEDHVKQMAIDRGYEIGTGQYKRRVVVDSSLFSTEYESQVVRKYEYFKTSIMEFSFDLNSLLRNDADTITLLAARAKNELDSWRKKTYDGKDSELAEHVGEAGKLKDPPDPLSSRGSNTDDPGKGQFGAIILDFTWNDVRKNYGLSQLDAALWDKKLWTGKGVLGLEAPSLRTTATIAATVVATAVSSAVSFGTAGPVVAALGSAAISASITMSNELLFTALDVAGGYKSLYEAGKQLGASLVTSSLGGGFGAAGAAVKGISGAAGVLIRTGLTAAEQTATKAATTFIASGGSWNAVKKSFDSFDDWSGIITSTAGSFVTNTMGAFKSFDADGNLLNDKTFQTGTVGKLNSLAGGLVSSALSYGLTGETTLNVLNLADFGAGYNVGLFEVTLSKKNGISSRFGTGGLDVSASGIKTAYSGYKESSKIVDYKYGSLEQKSTLNAVNLMGWSGSGAATKFSQDIWNGKINVKYEKLAYDENNKVYGYHDAREGKTITLNSSLLGGGTEESAKLGAVMTHEGIHADGDRIEAHAHEAALDMYSRLTEKLGLEGDGAFSQVMFDAICNPENLKENEGERDYWKLVKQENGKYGLKYDGYHSLYDEQGNLLIKNEMDEFDENGNNQGPWKLDNRDYSSYYSFSASLGMLTGTYTNYMYDKDAYELGYNDLGNSDLRQTTDARLRTAGAKTLNDLNSKEIIVDANPYLMTNIGIIRGDGVTTVSTPNGLISQTVSIRDEYNNEVGTISNLNDIRNEKVNIFGIENMIPEGKRLKAGMIKFESGRITMYGLSSTMPDPENMEKHPALADGTYAYSFSLHRPGDVKAYPALRIYDTLPESWDQVIGKKSETPIKEGEDAPAWFSEFPYSETGGWGTNQKKTPGYIYDDDGIKQPKNTDYINFHKCFNNPFVNTIINKVSFIGGSEGCQTQHPYTFNQMISNFIFTRDPVYGYYTVDRSFFGDGTNGKNNWKTWK